MRSSDPHMIRAPNTPLFVVPALRAAFTKAR
jgi:hypothetical protein